MVTTTTASGGGHRHDTIAIRSDQAPMSGPEISPTSHTPTNDAPCNTCILLASPSFLRLRHPPSLPFHLSFFLPFPLPGCNSSCASLAPCPSRAATRAAKWHLVEPPARGDAATPHEVRRSGATRRSASCSAAPPTLRKATKRSFNTLTHSPYVPTPSIALAICRRCVCLCPVPRFVRMSAVWRWTVVRVRRCLRDC